MSYNVNVQPLKALLFKHLDTHNRDDDIRRGDGFRYVAGILDCIHELTGEDSDEVLAEVVKTLWPADNIRTECILRWKEGEKREDLMEEFNLTINQWTRIRGMWR